MMKKLSLSIAAIAFFIGCGSSSSSSTTSASAETQAPTTKTVTVVDNYIIGAQVCDTNGTCATTDGNGTATAAFIGNSFTAKGGYIDVNNNHQIDADDVKLPEDFTLQSSNSTLVSPVTDYVARGMNLDKLSTLTNISASELLSDPYKNNNVAVAKVFQILSIVKLNGKETALISKINEVNTTVAVNNVANSNPTQSTGLFDSLVSKGLFDSLVTSDNTQTESTQTTETNTTTTNTNTTATSSTANLSALYNLAIQVVTPEAKLAIDKVMSINVNNASEIEAQIASFKEKLLNNTNDAPMNTSTIPSTTVDTTTVASTTDTTSTTSTEPTTTNTETNTNTDNTTTSSGGLFDSLVTN
jgi:hypothetical protein